MSKKLLLVYFVLVLGLVTNTWAQDPAAQDIGNPAVAGGVVTDGVTWEITGAGADIWGNADQCFYVFRPLAGDGEGYARVVSMPSPHAWAKVGLMIRESTDAGAKGVNVVVTGANGVGTQWRDSTGGGSANAMTAGVMPPVYLKIERIGDQINTYYSPNPAFWIPQNSMTLSMNTDVLIGMCVTSHDEPNPLTATFDDVNLTAPPYPAAWNLSPADGLVIDPTGGITLSWMPGDGAASHDVRFGTTSPPDVVVNQAETSYDPGPLEGATVYYWQIDEVAGDGTVTPGEERMITTVRPGTGSITRDIWWNNSGVLVADLVNDSRYPQSPDETGEVGLLETPTDVADNYGVRLHGYLLPETSGDYTFWVAADDGCRLYLSTTDSPLDAVEIAGHDSWTASRGWDDFPSQKSAVIPLVGGEKYYISAIMNEGGGGDNLAAAWEGPDSPTRDVIDGYYLMPFIGPWPFASNPSPGDGASGVSVTPTLGWTAPATGADSYDVYLNGALVANVTEPSAAVGPLDMLSTNSWRVDAVSGGDVTEGFTWSLTATDYRVVDDFEAYTVLPVDPPGQSLMSGKTVPALWGYYPLNGDTLDASGNGNHGTATGGTYVAGADGDAMLFTPAGGDDYVDLGTADPSADTGELSLSLWLNWNGLSTEWQGLIGKRDNWAANDMMWHLECDLNTGDLGANREAGQYVGGYGVPVVGEWEHCAFTSDGSNGTMYKNGAQVGSGAFTYGTDPEARVVFGCDNAWGWNAFNGALDEVRIYTKVLTADQVAELAALGDPAVDPTVFPPFYSPMRLRLEFEGDYADSSGNGNDGTPVGDISFEIDPVMGQVVSLPGGSNQFVDVGSVGLSGKDPTTIACWAKADNTSIPDWTLVFGFTGTDTGAGGTGSHFNIGSLGGPGGVGAHVWGWEETIFSDQEALDWHHYAMTYDGTTIRYYGDGSPKDTDPGKSNVMDLSIRADRVHVGSRITQDSSFPGKVDDARVYDYALSDAEVLAISGGAFNGIGDTWSRWGLVKASGGDGTMKVNAFGLPGLPYFMGEVSRDLPFDLTANGGKALSVWFQGDQANAAEYMYMTLSNGGGSATVLYDGGGLDSADWQNWSIDMRDFGGAEAGADEIAIGIAGLDGATADVVTLDDLRVYTSRCLPDVIQPVADLNNDCKVDIGDVEVMIDAWGATSEAVISDEWVAVDIDEEGGSTVIEDGTFTLTGEGADIWGNADQFHYAYRTLQGDGEIQARVVEIGPGTNTWAKAGVMIRDTLAADSKHMIMAMTSQDGGGICFQGRASTGGGSTSFHDEVIASPPHWVKLVRVGNTITAYHSADGAAWDLMTDSAPDGAHSNPMNVSMGATVNIGLFITSHQDGELRTAVIDNVTITGLPTELPADISGDGKVGWADLFMLLDEWLVETPWPY